MQTGEGAPGEGLRAIAIEQIDGARAVLGREDLPIAKRVHEARKHMKRIRALLRLIQEPLGGRFRETRRSIRDAARRLSASRDATVIHIAFRDVVEAGVDDADADAIDSIGVRLRKRAESAEREDGSYARAASEVDATLAAVRQDALGWDLGGYDAGDLVLACAGTYRRARRELRRVRKNFGSGRVHEWRKSVKEHWYHMRLLHDPTREPLDALGELLGHANDLAVLGEALAGAVVRDEALERTVEQLRRRTVRDAVTQAEEIFARKPIEFATDLLVSL